MRERPILFSGPMVRAILDGRKTQTRRVVKPQPSTQLLGRVGTQFVFAPTDHDGGQLDCPFGVPGDRLWVRETFLLEDNREYFGDAEFAPPQDGRPIHHHAPLNEYDAEHDLIPRYRATEPDFALECEHEDCNEALGPCMHPWRPSIFMPRWASRITLEITDVRVQRVQEISEDDAQAEGAMEWWNSLTRAAQEQIYSGGRGPCGAFHDLWDSINGKTHPWANNDWVWAVSFRRSA